MTDRELGWVAGILEGEGCFDFIKRNDPRYIRIRMETTDFDVAARLQSLIGGQIQPRTRKRAAHHKDSYQFRLTSSKNVREILHQILPQMSLRRSAKIKEMLAGSD